MREYESNQSLSMQECWSDVISDDIKLFFFISNPRKNVYCNKKLDMEKIKVTSQES